MDKIFLLAVCLVLFRTAFSQNWQSRFGAVSESMGGITTTLQGEEALFNNLSGITHEEGLSVGSSFANRFGLAAFNTVGTAIGYAHKQHGLQLAITRFGDKVFNQSSLSIGYAHQLDGVSMGLKLNLWQLRIAEAGSWQAPTIDADVQVTLSEQWLLGAQLINLGQSRLNNDWQEPLPSLLRLAMAYSPSQTLKIGLEAEKELLAPILLKAGIAYAINEQVTLRTGWVIPQNSFSFGTGIHWEGWQFSYALSNHLLMGTQHQFGFIWLLGQAKQFTERP